MIKSNNPLYIDTWRNAKELIRVNEADCELFRPYNSNVHNIPNGYDPAKFHPLDKNTCRKKLGIPQDRKVIVNIAFYVGKKNQTLLIHAIRDLEPEIRNNLTCFLIGGGPMANQLEQEIKSCGLEGTVILTGQVKHAELNVYLNSADVFCLPSNSEGNPTVMFEALGTGLPFVGTDSGGVADVITSEEFGYVSKIHDKEALTINLRKALTKEWNHEAILAHADNYTWKSIVLKTLDLY
jgi:glycosyltransferase involved in cell wall biosynthesis